MKNTSTLFPVKVKVLYFFLLVLLGFQLQAQHFSAVELGAPSAVSASSVTFNATSTNPDIAFLRATVVAGDLGSWFTAGADNMAFRHDNNNAESTLLFEFLDINENPVIDDYRITFNDIDGPPGDENLEYTCNSNFKFVAGDTDINISTTGTGLLASGTIDGTAGSVMFEVKDTGSFELILRGNNTYIKVIEFDDDEYSVSPPYLYNICPQDTDGDGINDDIDEDDDNDGITDIAESGGYEPDGDADGDGLPNFEDIIDNTGEAGIPAGDGSLTNYTDANNNGVPDVYDSDGDSIPNHLEHDSDNDLCNDTTEAGFIDGDGDGYLGTSPVTVDGTGRVTGQGGYTGTNPNVTTFGPDADGDYIADSCDTFIGTPFSCDGTLYITINGQLNAYDPLAQTFSTVGANSVNINGIGYNTSNNFA